MLAHSYEKDVLQYIARIFRENIKKMCWMDMDKETMTFYDDAPLSLNAIWCKNGKSINAITLMDFIRYSGRKSGNKKILSQACLLGYIRVANKRLKKIVEFFYFHCQCQVHEHYFNLSTRAVQTYVCSNINSMHSWAWHESNKALCCINFSSLII